MSSLPYPLARPSSNPKISNRIKVTSSQDHKPTPSSKDLEVRVSLAEAPSLTGHIMKENISRSLLKAISWRLIASVTTFFVTWIIITFSGYEFSISPVDLSLRITALEAITKMAIYFFHERMWLRVSYGKNFAQTSQKKK